MKRLIIAVCLLTLSQPAFASEVIPPRMAVRWLIQAVQANQTNNIASQFGFDADKHGKLTPLSRDEQLRLLKDLPVDKLKFDKNEYAVDEGRRFVVKLVAPVELEFEIEYVELKGDIGPPWKYVVIAIRKTAQPSSSVDGKPAPEK